MGSCRKSHHRTCSFAVRPCCDMCGLVRDRDHDCQSPLTLLCRRHHCDPVRTAWACGMTGPAEASVVTYESGVGASGSCEGHAWVSLRGKVPETPGLELRLLCPRLASCCVVNFEWLPQSPGDSISFLSKKGATTTTAWSYPAPSQTFQEPSSVFSSV